MISDNPNVSLGIVDVSFYTRGFALMTHHHEKRRGVLAYTSVEDNYLEVPAKTFIVAATARQNQFNQENIFTNAPNRRICIAMSTNSAFTGSYTGNPFWYQHFDPRQNRILKVGQPIKNFDPADDFCLNITILKTKAMNFQDDIPSILKDNINDDYTLVFDLTSMQDAAEKYPYPELFVEQLTMQVNFTFPLQHVSELNLLGERMSLVAVDEIGVVRKLSKMDIAPLKNNQSYPDTQVSIPWSISF